MPVIAEHASECLKPKGIGQSPHQFCIIYEAPRLVPLLDLVAEKSGWGKERDLIDFGGMKLSYLDYRRGEYIALPETSMAGKAWDFGQYEYGVAAYSKPAVALLTLQNYLGEEKMDALLQAYFSHWRFGHPTALDFQAVAVKETGDSLNWFFGDPRVKTGLVYGIETLNYMAKEIGSDWLTVTREGSPHARTEIVLYDELKRVDLLFVNDAEARQLAGEANVVKSARAILAMGPRAVVVKRGEHGALFFSGEEVFAAVAYPLPSVFDPTGAGDSFAGGFMGYLARTRRHDAATMRRAIVLGSVLASFAVEQFSVDRFRSLAPAEIRTRYAELRRLTHFDELEPELLG